MDMAHHHHAPNHPHDEGDKFESANESSSPAATPNHYFHEIKKEQVKTAPPAKGKSVFDYQIAGFPWSFVAVMALIAIGVLGMILKVMGLF
jgi:hypothetical protein